MTPPLAFAKAAKALIETYKGAKTEAAAAHG